MNTSPAEQYEQLRVWSIWLWIIENTTYMTVECNANGCYC